MVSSLIDGQSAQSLLDELRARHNVVGATLGILKDGAIETAGSGLLNLDTGVECTPNSIFQIGSIGKAFTATLMMQLVDEGRVGLDEPVVKYLPDFTLADAAAARAVTIRQLLNHTSGMDGDFFPTDDPEGPSTASYVRKMCLLPNLFPPGEGPMTYCNSGYVVAGRVVEVLTGMTWQNAVMERICRPLELPAAFAHPHEALRYRCAMGHIADPTDPKKMAPAPATFLMQSAAAAGAVLSMSVQSLLLFAKAHMSDGEYGGGKRLLTAKSARAMREEKTVVPPPMSPDITHWGLGWLLGEAPEYRMAGHDGGTLGQLAYLRTFPGRGVAFALLTNSPGRELFKDLETRLMSTLIGAAIPADPSRQDFEPVTDRYVGEYASLGMRVAIDLDEGNLVIRVAFSLAGAPSVTAVLEPYQPDIFTMHSDSPILANQKIAFLDDDGKFRAIFARIGGRMIRRMPG